ncbi:MAG: hypothetical protein AAF429_03930 [Pseudomonadota bacterium]
MGRNEPIPAGIDENGDVIPLEVGEFSAIDYAAVKIFVAGVNVGHELVYCRQTSPNSRTFSKWQNMGKQTYYYPMDCSTTIGGDVVIVAIATETNTVQYFAETPNKTAESPDWLPPEDLGAPSGIDLAGVYAIQVAQDLNGRDCVFVSVAHPKGQTLWWKYRNPPQIVEKTIEVTPPGAKDPIKITVQESEPPAQPWSDWINLNGNVQGAFKSLCVTNNADGRLVITGNLEDDDTAHVRQQDTDNPYDTDKWLDWVQPGGAANGAVAQLVKPILDGEGYVSIFGNFAGTLMRSRQKTPGSADWSDWSAPGLTEDTLGDYSASIDGDGCVYVMALNMPEGSASTKILLNREFNTAHAAWVGWQWSAMTNAGSRIELSYSADGSISAFVQVPSGGDLLVFNQVAIDSTEWYAQPTNIGGQLNTFALTRDMTP